MRSSTSFELDAATAPPLLHRDREVLSARGARRSYGSDSRGLKSGSGAGGPRSIRRRSLLRHLCPAFPPLPSPSSPEFREIPRLQLAIVDKVPYSEGTVTTPVVGESQATTRRTPTSPSMLPRIVTSCQFLNAYAAAPARPYMGMEIRVPLELSSPKLEILPLDSTLNRLLCRSRTQPFSPSSARTPPIPIKVIPI